MEINNILVTGRLFEDLQDAIRLENDKKIRFLSENEVSIADIRWADAFVGFRPTTNFEFAGLKWIHSLGAGVDRFLYSRAWKNDVILTRTICSFGQKISEYCLSYMLRTLQFHGKFAENQKTHLWQPVEPCTLRSQNVVVFGTGSIGQEVARNISYFGADVSGVSLSGRAQAPFSRVLRPCQVNCVLHEANWLINTLPLTKHTEKFFNDQIFNLLDNACFINVGRGLSVDEQALVEALNNKNLRLAVLDVFEEEPLLKESALWERDDIIVTPHISGITSIAEAAECFLETLKYIEKGHVPPNAVEIDKGY